MYVCTHACMYVLCMHACMYYIRRADIGALIGALCGIDMSQVKYACIENVCIYRRADSTGSTIYVCMHACMYVLCMYVCMYVCTPIGAPFGGPIANRRADRRAVGIDASQVNMHVLRMYVGLYVANAPFNRS